MERYFIDSNIFLRFYNSDEPGQKNIVKSIDEAYVRAAINLARKKGQSYSDSYIAVVANDNNIGVASFNAKHFSKLDVRMYPLAVEG
jgi:predicted nucleic acid-binding protein